MKILGKGGKVFASEVMKLILLTGLNFRKQNLHVFCSLLCLLLPEVNILPHSCWKEGEREKRDVLASKKKMGNCLKIFICFYLYLIFYFIIYMLHIYILFCVLYTY